MEKTDGSPQRPGWPAAAPIWVAGLKRSRCKAYKSPALSARASVSVGSQPPSVYVPPTSPGYKGDSRRPWKPPAPVPCRGEGAQVFQPSLRHGIGRRLIPQSMNSGGQRNSGAVPIRDNAHPREHTGYQSQEKGRRRKGSARPPAQTPSQKQLSLPDTAPARRRSPKFRTDTEAKHRRDAQEMGETPAIPDGSPRHNAQQQGEQRRRQGIHTAGFIRRIIVSRFLGEKTPCVPHQSGQAVGQLFPAQQTGQKRRSAQAQSRPSLPGALPGQQNHRHRSWHKPTACQAAPQSSAASPHSPKNTGTTGRSRDSRWEKESVSRRRPTVSRNTVFFRFQLSLNSNSNFSGLPQPSPV